jgi:antitoxin (DNA-binding transcriptional repressor) of toxin-antitoxin stability system
MSQKISATEAARSFSELLNRVHYRGESFDVVRNGEVVARITSSSAQQRVDAQALIAALAAAGHADECFADDLERIQREQPLLPHDPWES